jgi:tripartite-type tricarboxylate transporter receptor subunit TctC
MPALQRLSMIGLAIIGALAIYSVALAQDYPGRPVSLVVPYTPGASTDLVARLYGQRLEQRLGKPLVIENRTGAATLIGASYVARAEPDGHSLLFATSTTMAINVSLYKKLPYDPEHDFAPVALVASNPFILVVNPALRVNSIADLVSLAKSKPSALTFASTGAGSAAHLFAELVKGMTGIAMTQVPYRGLAPGLNDVVAGHVSLMFGDFATSLPLIRAGKLTALGVSTAARNAAAPDIPPLAEAGLPGYDAASWMMIVAPAKTPKAIVDRLNTDLRAIATEPAVQQDLLARGLSPIVTAPPAELARYVQAEILRWGKVVEQAGIAGTE